MSATRFIQVALRIVCMGTWWSAGCDSPPDRADMDAALVADANRSDAADRATDASPIDAADQAADAGPLPDDLLDLIAMMPSKSWLALPGSDMGAACPPPGPGYACWSVIAAWGGGTYDTARDRMVIFGGGHADSHINNVFVYDLRERRWRRETELPAGVDGASRPPSWLQTEFESCGYYPRSLDRVSIPPEWLTTDPSYIRIRRELCRSPEVMAVIDDQQPRSAHTYGHLMFDVERNRLCSFGQVAMFPSGQGNSPNVDCYDFDDRRWHYVGDNPFPSVNSTSAVDGLGRAWYLARGAVSFDLASNEIHVHRGVAFDIEGGAAIDVVRNRLVRAGPAGVLQALDLAAPDAVQNVGSSESLPLGYFYGFDYATSEDRFYAWDGGRTVYVLHPEMFAWSTINATGDDPGPALPAGTFGRFRWAPNLGVFVLVNSGDAHNFAGAPNVFLFKP
jgi:hypothetical protein